MALYLSTNNFANFVNFELINNTMMSKFFKDSYLDILISAWRMFDIYTNYLVFISDFLIFNNTAIANGKTYFKIILLNFF